MIQKVFLVEMLCQIRLKTSLTSLGMKDASHHRSCQPADRTGQLIQSRCPPRLGEPAGGHASDVRPGPDSRKKGSAEAA